VPARRNRGEVREVEELEVGEVLAIPGARDQRLRDGELQRLDRTQGEDRLDQTETVVFAKSAEDLADARARLEPRLRPRRSSRNDLVPGFHPPSMVAASRLRGSTGAQQQ
jgi:hypothetical protein